MLDQDALPAPAFFACWRRSTSSGRSGGGASWRKMPTLPTSLACAQQRWRRPKSRLAQCKLENRGLSKAVGLLQHGCEQTAERLNAFEDAVQRRPARPELDGCLLSFGAFEPN